MYQALYRKWRPQTFEDVYGQEHITSILKSEVENEKISHAYLFCGPRGTGKTTCAKIIAKAVNCEHPKNGDPCGECAACKLIESGLATDILEMDAASNNGVDNIRELRDGVVYTPAELKYRVYIIDEVHMLSISAFNALLKTLEEPPKYVIFILATTELHKIPATVLSRCQRFDFRRVAPAALIDRMKTVCAGEGIDADDGALSLIARLSQGSFRDALNMLEFCSGESKTITAESAGRLLGSSSMQTLSELSAAIAGGDVARALDTVHTMPLWRSTNCARRGRRLRRNPTIPTYGLRRRKARTALRRWWRTSGTGKCPSRLTSADARCRGAASPTDRARGRNANCRPPCRLIRSS